MERPPDAGTEQDKSTGRQGERKDARALGLAVSLPERVGDADQQGRQHPEQ